MEKILIPHILLCNSRTPTTTLKRRSSVNSIYVPPHPHPQANRLSTWAKIFVIPLDSALSAGDIEGGERLWVLCSLKSVNGKAPGHVGDSR
ncbi:hypothetical protein CDAR_366671 [Caerostris darwini]|uniref:Uncharacterized protein n=1 Tax=Caerostris darwini TaxID=1538125 RepID=A0AAV4Q5J0_9ARAC|nr:hypothetical protein CDAR_366671 [Caerostris darwini]